MIAKPPSKARTFGWILLLIGGILLTVGSIFSTYIAYVGSNTPQTDPHIDQLRALSAELARDAQARRGTAAAWAAAFGFLYCFVVATGFRRGEQWAWWAVLLSTGVAALLSALRIPLLEGAIGSGTSATLLAVTLIGALVPVRDFFGD